MRILTSLIVIASLVVPACAHHAMEFIQMESYSTTRAGEKVFHLHYDYMVDDAENPLLDHWEFTPGISYGITNRLMLDVHTHLAKFGPDHLLTADPAYSADGPSPFMEALAVAVQYRLTQGAFVDVALVGVFEQPYARSQDLLGGEQVYEGMVVLSRGLGQHSTFAANLSYALEGDETSAAYALGLKTPLTSDPHGFQAGVELLGDFEGGWSILPGFYFPLASQNTVFKSGIELGDGTLRLNTTLMVIF